MPVQGVYDTSVYSRYVDVFDLYVTKTPYAYTYYAARSSCNAPTEIKNTPCFDQSTVLQGWYTNTSVLAREPHASRLQ